MATSSAPKASSLIMPIFESLLHYDPYGGVPTSSMSSRTAPLDGTAARLPTRSTGRLARAAAAGVEVLTAVSTFFGRSRITSSYASHHATTSNVISASVAVELCLPVPAVHVTRDAVPAGGTAWRKSLNGMRGLTSRVILVSSAHSFAPLPSRDEMW